MYFLLQNQNCISQIATIQGFQIREICLYPYSVEYPFPEYIFTKKAYWKCIQKYAHRIQILSCLLRTSITCKLFYSPLFSKELFNVNYSFKQYIASKVQTENFQSNAKMKQKQMFLRKFKTMFIKYFNLEFQIVNFNIAIKNHNKIKVVHKLF